MFAPTAQVSNDIYTDAKTIFVEHRNPSKKEYALYAKAVRQRTDISDGAKITYLEILDFDFESSQTGVCKGYSFPSTKTLAKLRGVSERTIRGHIDELVSTGVLGRARRKNTSSILYIEDVTKTSVEQHTKPCHPATAKICRSQEPPLQSVASHKASFQSTNPERQKTAIAYIDENTRNTETTTNKAVVAEKLERLKIAPDKARSLASQYPAEHIQAQVQELERRLRCRGSGDLIHNPAGWLIRAIERAEVQSLEVKKPPVPQVQPVYDELGEVTYYELSEVQEAEC
jgi:hypothetical protein